MTHHNRVPFHLGTAGDLSNTARLLFLALVLLIQPSSGQWTFQAKPTTARLHGASFVDSLRGWAVGVFYPQDSSTVIKTTDGGATWTASLFAGFDLSDIAFVDSLNGWAVGGTSSGRSLILRSSDGGNTWNVVDSSLAGGGFSYLQFLDKQHGWIGGWVDTAGIVLRTIDGGSTWQTTIDTSFRVVDLSFPDAKHGWIVSTGGKLFYSTDGGSSWHFSYRVQESLSPPVSAFMRRVFFADSMHGCAVGGIGGVETKAWTHDGGASWNVTNQVVGSGMRGLWFTDKYSGWCVGGISAGIKIHRTTDGGITWEEQAVPPGYQGVADPFREVIFTSPTQGWIFAEGGYVFHTINGGGATTSSIAVQPTHKPATFHLGHNFPNPFNPSTSIPFALSSDGFVSLAIFDELGRRVATLCASVLSAGPHTYAWDASSMPSGVYVARLQFERSAEYRSLMLLK